MLGWYAISLKCLWQYTHGYQMIHAWDHFDYTNDVQWWKSQGWPLVKVIMFVVL